MLRRCHFVGGGAILAGADRNFNAKFLHRVCGQVHIAAAFKGSAHLNGAGGFHQWGGKQQSADELAGHIARQRKGTGAQAAKNRNALFVLFKTQPLALKQLGINFLRALSLQNTGRVMVAKPSALPRPVMVSSCSPRSTLAPSCWAAPNVARISCENSTLPMWLVPAARAAHTTARCAALLLGGTAAVPARRPGSMAATVASTVFPSFVPFRHQMLFQTPARRFLLCFPGGRCYPPRHRTLRGKAASARLPSCAGRGRCPVF